MLLFDELIAMGFQINEVLFDYGNEAIGKPTGIDIKERKMTLPLIYALNQADPKDRRWLINSVRNHNTNRKRVKEIIAYVKNVGGLEYAVKAMLDYKEHALEVLNDYHDSPYKNSLLVMVEYVIDRKK